MGGHNRSVNGRVAAAAAAHVAVAAVFGITSGGWLRQVIIRIARDLCPRRIAFFATLYAQLLLTFTTATRIASVIVGYHSIFSVTFSIAIVYVKVQPIGLRKSCGVPRKGNDDAAPVEVDNREGGDEALAAAGVAGAEDRGEARTGTIDYIASAPRCNISGCLRRPRGGKVGR